ncbi:MAG: hypothetical protein ACLGIC_07595 [Acidimicrobiia bacterium]
MIFVSIALLVVAAIALGIGIVSSSVPPLVVSIVATLAAAGTLWASFIHYRRDAAEHGLPVVGLGGNQPRNPGYPEAYSANGSPSVATAAAAHTNPAAAAAAPPAAPAPAPVASTWAPPAGWDHLDEERATALVSAFGLEELHELRRHEVEHGFRQPVLAEIDQRITTIVELRRRAEGAVPERPLKAR